MASSDEKDFQAEEVKYVKYLENYYSERGKSPYKIKTIALTPCCSEGDNFASEVIRITIVGNYLHNQDQSDTTKSVVIKKLPSIDSPQNLIQDLSKLFRNEIIAYEEILPVFRKFGQKHDIHLCFPEYHGRGEDFLVLEDLKFRSYQMVDPSQGLNLKECAMVLRELALFHAISFALKKEDIFREKTSQLQESIYCPEYVDGILEVIWENSLKFAVKSLQTSKDERLVKAGKQLEKYSGSVLYHLLEITKPPDRYGVICHGDLWSNNVMIRYEDDGGRSPIGVKLLDLQALRHSSCVLDVMHLIFTSTKLRTSQIHFDDLLKIYFDSLNSAFKTLRKELHFTFEDFKREFGGKVSYGLLVAFLMFTVVTRKKGEEMTVPPLDVEQLKSESVFSKMYDQLNSDYHERTRDLVSELLNSRLLNLD